MTSALDYSSVPDRRESRPANQYHYDTTGGPLTVIHDEFPGVALRNVAETDAPGWADGGHRLRRVPAAVGDALTGVGPLLD